MSTIQEQIIAKLYSLSDSTLAEILVFVDSLSWRTPKTGLVTSMPRQSLWGLCAHLGEAPTDENINQARQEAWDTFPREDI